MIRVRSLRKRYGRIMALADVDLDFPAACVTAVVGPNSAGKSTLLKAILGLVRPDAGTIEIAGEPVRRGGRLSGVGYMRQMPFFPAHLTGRELLDMLRRLQPDRATDDGLIDALRLGGELDKPLRTLSGGTRQKLNAAAALLFRPPVLVLDEPTAGMDPIVARIFKQKVRQARDRGSTVLLTSHVVSELQDLADRLVLLVDGRVRFSGERDALSGRRGAGGLEDALATLMEAS